MAENDPVNGRERTSILRALLVAGAALVAIALLLYVLMPNLAGSRENARLPAPASAQLQSSLQGPSGGAMTPSESALHDFDESTGAGSVLPAASMPRKIIHTATVTLVANDLSVVERELERLVNERGGYIAGTDVTGSPGELRQGRWTVRVPVAQFRPLLAALVKLGELQTSHTDSQDVSEEFYDLEARLSNKRVEEQRLLQHLRRTTGTLRDILTIERELSRVRAEIEQIQGRLRFLASQADLSTITVTVEETRGYRPPTGTTFGSQIARTFQGSVDVLRELGKTLVLLAVALGPWLLALVLIGGPVWVLVRRRRKSNAKPGA